MYGKPPARFHLLEKSHFSPWTPLLLIVSSLLVLGCIESAILLEMGHQSRRIFLNRWKLESKMSSQKRVNRYGFFLVSTVLLEMGSVQMYVLSQWSKPGWQQGRRKQIHLSRVFSPFCTPPSPAAKGVQHFFHILLSFHTLRLSSLSPHSDHLPEWWVWHQRVPEVVAFWSSTRDCSRQPASSDPDQVNIHIVSFKLTSTYFVNCWRTNRMLPQLDLTSEITLHWDRNSTCMKIKWETCGSL